MRKAKSGRTADLPAEHPPASLIWTMERCALLAMYLFRFIEVSFGRKVAKEIWAEAQRRPRERSIKASSDADLALVRRYYGERKKAVVAGEDPQPAPGTLARRVAQSMTPEEARGLGINTHAVGDDFHRTVILAVLRRVALYEKTENGYRMAAAVPDPMTAIVYLDTDRLPPRPE